MSLIFYSVLTRQESQETGKEFFERILEQIECEFNVTCDMEKSVQILINGKCHPEKMVKEIQTWNDWALQDFKKCAPTCFWNISRAENTDEDPVKALRLDESDSNITRLTYAVDFLEGTVRPYNPLACIHGDLQTALTQEEKEELIADVENCFLLHVSVLS